MRIFVAAAMLSLVACASASTESGRPAAPRPDTLRTETVARGVSHEYRWYASGPWAVHTVTIDPRACGIELRTIKALDRTIGRETTTSMARRAGERFGRPVLVAVNADFFSFDPPGVSEGPQISNGALIKSEGNHREAIEDRVVRLSPVFAVDRKRNAFLSHTQLRGSVQLRGATLPLAGVNVRTRNDAATIFDLWFGDATPADTGALELIARNVTATSQRRGVVIGVDTSAAGVTIPKDGFVIAARGSARSALTRITAGDTVTWQASFDSLPALSELIGGYPMLLRKGKAVHHDEAGLRTTFSDRRHPRLAIGIDDKRRVHLVAVDGRREGYSAGMTLQELSDYLLAHNIREALNFDGGGSTTVVIRDRIANRPTDQTGERPVSNALVVLGPAAGACR